MPLYHYIVRRLRSPYRWWTHTDLTEQGCRIEMKDNLVHWMRSSCPTVKEITAAVPASILAGHSIQLRWLKSNERRAVGRVSRHTEDAEVPRAQQGWALPLPSPPKVKGVEMAQQYPSKSDSHGDGCLQGRGIMQGYSRWQRKAAQSRAGVTMIYPDPSLCSNCQLLLPKCQSQWEASGQGRQTVQTLGASFLVTEQRRL